MDPRLELAADPAYADLIQSIEEEQEQLRLLEQRHQLNMTYIEGQIKLNVQKLEMITSSDAHSEQADRFNYRYLDQRVKNDTFNKIFEIRGDDKHFYVFTENN